MVGDGMTGVASGTRIRLYRQRLGITQEVLAGRAGVSKSWLSKVERGVLSPGTVRSIIPLAEALGVDVTDVMDRPGRPDADAAVEEASTTPLLRVLTDYSDLVGAAAHRSASPNLAGLLAELLRARQVRRQCRFAEAAEQLSRLIVDAEAAAQMLAGQDDAPAAYWILAQTYRCATYTLLRSGERDDLAWIAADRCARASKLSRNVLLQARGARCLAHVFLHSGRIDEALTVTGRALDGLDADHGAAPSPAYLATFGSLLLVGSLAAARGNDRAASQRFLRNAERIAEQVQRDDGFFGPTNVAIHGVSAAAELGDATEVIRLGYQVDTSALPADACGRRAQVHLDVARGYEAKRQDEAALHRLLHAERLAPELTHRQPHVREMIAGMLRRGHRTPSIPGLRELAARSGVLHGDA
jgi:transcriptional regulator with XRE-family HTH domain